MRILFIAHRLPYPPDKGDKIRSFNEIKHLSAEHDLDLVCFADDPTDLKHRARLEEHCRSVEIVPLDKRGAKARALLALLSGSKPFTLGYFYDRRMERLVENKLRAGSYDLIMAYSSSMAQYVMRAEAGPKIIDLVDVDSDKWGQYAARHRFPASLLYRLEQRRLAAYEKEIARNFDRCLLISREEADLFQRIAGGTTPTVIPNGVDADHFDPRRCAARPSGLELKRPCLVFAGSMDYFPNADGVVYFCKTILPEIKRHVPEINFYIVGRNPGKAVRGLACDSVFVTGAVEDVRPVLAGAELAIAPLRVARGVQNKLLEFMAMGLAVVATSKAVEGISAVDGIHLSIADDPKEFAEATVDLLKNPNRRRRLGANARELVRYCYSWNKMYRGLDALLESLQEKGARSQESGAGIISISVQPSAFSRQQDREKQRLAYKP